MHAADFMQDAPSVQFNLGEACETDRVDVGLPTAVSQVVFARFRAILASLFADHCGGVDRFRTADPP
jgi:hypothetical protein